MERAVTPQPNEGKRRPPQKSGRHDARKFIAPVQALIREAFRNTGDTEQVSRYHEATRASVDDVVKSGHGAQLDEYGSRLDVIEARLGLRRATNAIGRPYLITRRAS